MPLFTPLLDRGEGFRPPPPPAFFRGLRRLFGVKVGGVPLDLSEGPGPPPAKRILSDQGGGRASSENRFYLIWFIFIQFMQGGPTPPGGGLNHPWDQNFFFASALCWKTSVFIIRFCQVDDKNPCHRNSGHVLKTLKNLSHALRQVSSQGRGGDRPLLPHSWVGGRGPWNTPPLISHRCGGSPPKFLLFSNFTIFVLAISVTSQKFCPELHGRFGEVTFFGPGKESVTRTAPLLSLGGGPPTPAPPPPIWPPGQTFRCGSLLAFDLPRLLDMGLEAPATLLFQPTPTCSLDSFPQGGAVFLLCGFLYLYGILSLLWLMSTTQAFFKHFFQNLKGIIYSSLRRHFPGRPKGGPGIELTNQRFWFCIWSNIKKVKKALTVEFWLDR